jgi:hypothetical protein
VVTVRLDISVSTVWKGNISDKVKAALVGEAQARAQGITTELAPVLKQTYDMRGGRVYSGRMRESLTAVPAKEGPGADDFSLLEWGYFPNLVTSGPGPGESELSAYLRPVELGYGGQRLPPLDRIAAWAGVRAIPTDRRTVHNIAAALTLGRYGLEVLSTFQASEIYHSIVDRGMTGVIADAVRVAVGQITTSVFSRGGKTQTRFRSVQTGRFVKGTAAAAGVI